jgi:type IV secretory pathway TrbD component
MRDLPNGFEVPVYCGLQHVQTLAGGPRKCTVLLLTKGMVALLWHLWMALPFLAIAHGVAVWGMKQDDHWFAIVLAVRGQSPFYEG